ncbi:MAG TPA: hypothetical protein VHI32_03920 [Burkholderiales bacterium]|nr:hypothetical protein [Burkholderiales bacterium]
MCVKESRRPGPILPLYGDALAQRPDQKALAVYLAIMVAGSGFMIVVAVGGLIRNLLSFRCREDPRRGLL